MRVLMVAHTFMPESMGGVENHALRLMQDLRILGHQAAIMYRIHAPDSEEYALQLREFAGIPTYAVVHNFRGGVPTPHHYYNRGIETRFLEVVAEFCPDVIHVHHLGGLSTSVIGAAKRLGLPVIWTLHDFWPMCVLSHLLTPDGRLCPGPDTGLRCVECLWLQRLAKPETLDLRARIRELGLGESLLRLPRFARDWVLLKLRGSDDTFKDEAAALPVRDRYMRQLLLQPDLLISPSRFLIDMFESWGVPRTRFHHLQNGVAPDLACHRIPSNAPRHAPFTFGFIGTVYPYKGADILIHAFAKAAIPDAALRLWGAQPGSRFQSYAKDLGALAQAVPNVVFEGAFAPPQLAEIMSAIDVLVVPSVLYENNPLVILEAFAMGIPVIAGNVGGMAELVQHEHNGLRFRVGDADDLAEKLHLITLPGNLERYRAGIQPPASTPEVASALVGIYERLTRHD